MTQMVGNARPVLVLCLSAVVLVGWAGVADGAYAVHTGTWTDNAPTFVAGETWTSPVNLADILDIAYYAGPGATGVAHVDVGGDVTCTTLSMGDDSRALLVVDGAMTTVGAYLGRDNGEARIVVRNNGSMTFQGTVSMGWGVGASTSDLVIEDNTQVAFGGSGALNVGYVAGNTSAITQTGGDVTATSRIYVQYHADANGSYTISGGSLEQTNAARDWAVGKTSGTGSGLFHVVGSGATITNVAHLKVYETGTLAFTINDAGGVSVVNASDFTVASGLLDMNLDGYVPNLGDTFDLVSLSNGTADFAYANLTLAAGDVGTWALVDPAGGSTLQVQYMVPEPMTLALLAVGGLCGLRRRR